MNNLHLNEQQLQDYAIAGAKDPAFAAHVAGCISCKAQISTYQLLFNHIREMERPLLDFKTEELLPDYLPGIYLEERKEARYLYGLLFGAVALLLAGLVVLWNYISWMFTGMTPLGVFIVLLLLTGLLFMQLTALYGSYRKNLSALNMEKIAT